MTTSAKFFLTLFSASLLLTACQSKSEQTAKPASSSQPSSSAIVKKQTSTSSEVSDDSVEDESQAVAQEQAKPETASDRPHITPFPDQLIGSWEFTPISETYKVILTFNPDGSALKELIDFESDTSHYRYSTIESSEMVGDGLYRFNNIGGDNEVTAGSGLGGYGHFEIGVLINGDGTITNQIWRFDPAQDPSTYEYFPKNGPVLTWVE